MAPAQCPQRLWEVQDTLKLLPGLVACISLLLLLLQQIRRCMKPKQNIDLLLSAQAEDSIEVPEQSRPIYHALFELLFIVGAIILNALNLGSNPSSGTLIGLITWLYDMILATLQLVLTSRWEIPNMRGHLCATYASQELTQVLLFRSAITQSSFSQIPTIIEFSLISLLFISAVTRKDFGAAPEEVKDGLQPSRESRASLISKITFSWIGGIVWKGYRKSLNMEDLWDLRSADKANTILKNYREPKKPGKLLWHLLYHFRISIYKQWIYSLLSTLLGLALILILKTILEYMENLSCKSGDVIWQYVILLLFAGITRTLIDQQSLWAGYQGCLRIRALLQGKIYAKTLKRKALANERDKNDENNQVDTSNTGDDSKSSSAQASIGTITSLMATDTATIADTISWIHESISVVPLQVIGCTILLWHIMGPSFIPGLIFLICFMFINIWYSGSISEVQKEIVIARDERIRATSEILHIICMIKIWAWEQHFLGLVSEKRSTELRAWYQLYATRGRRILSGDMVSFLVDFVSFLIYTIFKDKPLYPSVAFVAMGLFDKLKESLDTIVDTNIQIRKALIAASRVESFLNEPETEKYSQRRSAVHEEFNEVVGFSNASFCWDSIPEHGASAFVLKDLNIKFTIGKLNLITGPTGSGKTSLLLSLLGELTQTEGTLHMSLERDSQAEPIRSVAYCAQQPWLKNTTVRENILFGRSMDEQRYKDVLFACALDRDHEAFDQILVGENGVKLSGGQRQRVAIARALYSELPLVLLDDCLRSLDTHTAQLVFQGITGPLMYKRTCILVSHNIRLCLLHSYSVILLENGKTAIQGTPQDLIASGKFVGFDEDIEYLSAASSIKLEGIAKIATTKDGISSAQNSITGGIKLNALCLYLKSIDICWFWPLGIVVIVLQPLTGLASNIWVRQWATQYLISDIQTPEVNTEYYLVGYALFGMCGILTKFFHNLWTAYGSILASSCIHKRLIESVCRAEFSIFDSIPYGQFINRFSPDLDCVDGEVAFKIVSVKDDTLSLIISIVLISSIIPGFLPVTVFIGALYLLISMFYLESSRDLKRLDSDQKSRLFQQLNEAITGIVTIRAFGEENRFIEDNRELIDTYHRPWIYRCALNRLFAICMGFTGALVTLSTGIFISLRINTIDGGSVGLILKYALLFTYQVSCLVRDYMKMEQTNAPVARIQAYSNIRQERETIGSRMVMKAGWPSQGSIEFENFTTRYEAALKPVLTSISFKINSKEKIGVVGQSGAGKTSLALALIRGLLAEEGQILIDGCDINRVSLHTLRQSITFIPQDATLFRGTIRNNLDPFNDYTNEEIISALHRVGMAPIRYKDEFLYSSKMLSHGQCQLVCLARAFLKDPKVLVMDEATASIDHMTDAKIQAAIRKLQTTTITIAHRLQTVIDYDKVLVLDKGKVVEFGHPYNLLRSTSGGSLFKEMCQKSGHFKELQQAAKVAYEDKRLVDDES